MRPSSSSEEMASARISRSLKSLNFFFSIVLFFPYVHADFGLSRSARHSVPYQLAHYFRLPSRAAYLSRQHRTEPLTSPLVVRLPCSSPLTEGRVSDHKHTPSIGLRLAVYFLSWVLMMLPRLI